MAAQAQLTDGGVYQFVNVGKSDRSMAIGNLNKVVASTTVADDYAQLWYAESYGSGYTLRNLANGRYLYSPNATSNAWLTSKEVNTDNSVFTATSVDGNYAIAVSGKGGYNYMHADGGNNIVCWESSNANSQWTMNVVNIDAATLNANWNALAAIDPSASTVSNYQTHLDNLFSDKACTTLKKSFADESAVKNDADYIALPTTLQAMVLKVYKDSWAEDNYGANKSGWDAAYAKKYRVQLYEPYNEPEAAASALGINAHTNLNNPTGIFANDREALYVMVDGAIEEGASLYITSYTGNGNLGGYSNGVELKQGLNIVPSFGDGNNYCINYVVHTFDTSKGKGNKAKAYRLSAFDDLKIHIEGGYINGYYNKMGDKLYTPDQGADWDYLEARASQTTVTILGKYITLQFPLNDAVDNDGNTNKGMSYYLDQSNVEGIIDEWDNVMLWERLVLGLLDEETTNAEAKKSPYSTEDRVFDYTGNDGEFAAGYEDYYNVHGLSLGVGYNYMYGGWDHCGYHYNTMESILTNLPYNAGSHWGPGHEIGHQHQKLLTVNGLTEVTNNLFSNVVLWYYGETTSRVNGDEGSLSHVLAAFNTEGSDFFTNNIWALTHMYYKLFLYYHVLGHNTKFYPTLFEMLRQDPMSGGYDQNGATSLLHFYKKCCLASGDDLTEFFRAHGFFSVMDNRLVGDYSNSVYTTTQADIDAAIQEVKDLGYDENIAVLFINDATGETIKSHKGDNLDLYGETRVCAEVGGYASFTDNTTPDYTYSVSGTTVAMDGEGGTGFAIYNEKGEIIAFSDKKTFTISEECAVALASGKAEVKAVKADNTPVEVVDVMDTDNAEAKYVALGELLDAVKAVTDLADATGTKVGYYRTDLLTDLQAAYETAKTVYDDETVASYNAVYDVLYQEYANVIADDFARIGIIEGNAYRLINKAYSERSMGVNASNNQMFGSSTENSDVQKWYFEASNSEGRYYLKNKGTGKYPGNVSSGTVLSADKAVDTKGNDKGAYAYEMRNMGNGLWALVGSTGLHCSASQSYNIVGWGADAEASQWYITAVEVDQNAECLHELQTLIEKTESLVDEMTTVEGKGTIDMSTCSITSNATETGHETKYLLDGNAGTYFHTVWASSSVGEPHYLQVDLGEAKSLSEFVWTYTTYTTNWNADLPATVKVTGSADNQLWSDIATLTDLPSEKGTDYKSAVLGSSNQNFRYLRFTVTATSTGGKVNGQYYFGLGEMGLTRMSTFVETIDDRYANFITAEEVATVCDQVYAAQQTIALGSATSNDVAALQAQYDILLQAHQNANNVEFNAKKEELLALISSTNSLINECGTVTPVDATSVTLSTTNNSDAYYLTGGPSGPSEGSVDNLLEDNVTSYYVSNWNAQTEHPYLQVRLPEGKTLSEFTFTFTSRDGGRAPTPTEIVVSGSNDGATFTSIETFTKENDGFPEAANTDNKDAGKSVTWNSPIITASTAYQYLRFTVTKSERSNGGETDANGFYHYSISKFGLGTPSGYNITLGANAGGVTKELWLETRNAVAAAQASHDMATTEEQLQKAITKLTAQKVAFENAKKSSSTYSVIVVGGNENGGIIYNNVEYKDNDQFDAPSGLTAEDFTAIALNGYVAKGITVVDNVITVTYNKVYTVQILGGKDNGYVTYNENTYAAGDTIQVLGGIDATQITLVTLDGYTPAAVTVDNDAATISVTFTMIPLVDTEKYYTLACKATDHDAYIRDNGSVINGRSAEGSLFQFVKANDENGYYLKSYATDNYLNYNGTNISVDAEGTTIWTLASHSTGAMTLCIGNDQYLNNNGSADATCPYLQIKGHSGGPGASNACSLWTITEATPLDMTELKNLIDETSNLITEAANYSTSLNVTEELVSAAQTEVGNAQAKYDSKATTQSEYEATLAALQTAHDNLQTAIAYANLPVQLTFDANSPVTYKIKIARANTPVLAYDESSSMVAVTEFELGSKSHGWYFMATTDGKVRIMPYHNTNTTLALSTNDFNGGNSKVKGMAICAEGYTQEWTISNTSMNDANRNAGWYNITTINPSNTETTWYFSNHGGVANKMGFYNDADDDGSRFQFEKISFDKSEAYYTLYNYYHNDTKVKSGTITGGAGVGYYPETEATAYNTAYSNAEQTLKSAMATDEEYANAYNDLKAANEALELIMPEEDKFYRFVSVVKGNGTNAYVYANPADNKMYWGEGKANNDATTMWTITPTANGKYSVTNLHTGSSINTFIYYDPTPLSETAGEVSIVSLSANDGQIGIKCGDRMMHAQGGENAIVHWDTGANDGSAWCIVEVTNEEVNLVEFALTIGQYRHASLYLNYATKIPTGVKVFVAHTPNGDAGTVVAEELIGATILPANMGVIVQGDAGSYGFKYTTDGYNGEDPELLNGNRLGGSAYLKYQQVAKDGNRCCVFGRKGNEVGLYKNYIEYIDANGSQTRTAGEGESETTESFVDTDKGTHFMIPANKIYFEYDPSAVSNASAFRFRFNSKAEGTTAIDELFLGGDAIIYNLYGQRIVKIVEPGIYIINGKKFYVSEKMILNNE